MSYEIIYKLFTIQKGNEFIPFMVWGSNNCWEGNRRERTLRNMIYLSKKSYGSIQELRNDFRADECDNDLEDGNIQGRYKTSKNILNTLTKVIHSKDLQLYPRLVSLHYFEATDKEKQQIEDSYDQEIITVMTEQEEQIHKQNILNRLSSGLHKRLHDYYPNFIVYPYYLNEYAINLELNKNTTKRKVKTDEELNDILNKGYICNCMDNFNKNMQQFIGKRVIVKTNHGLKKGIVKQHDKFELHHRNKYQYLTLNGGGYAELKVLKIAKV